MEEYYCSKKLKVRRCLKEFGHLEEYNFLVNMVEYFTTFTLEEVGYLTYYQGFNVFKDKIH